MVLAPGTQDRVRRAFAELCSAANEEEFYDRLFRAPVLLRGDVVQWLADRIDRSTEPDKLSRLVAANEIRMSMLASEYPPDLGPVEQIWRRVDSGELSVEQAHLAARQLPVTESLMGLYVTHLFFSLAEGDSHVVWRRSRMRGEILLSALDACTHRDERALRRARLLGVIRWAHFLLTEVPEVRILELGDAAGQAALTDAQAEKDDDEIRHMSYELAALWGDPYVGDRSIAAHQQDMMAWRRRGAEVLGRGEGLGPEAWAMPEPEEALRTSIGYWRIARAAAPADPAVLIGLAEAATFLRGVTSEELAADAVSAVREGVAITAEPGSDAVLRHRFLALNAQLSPERPTEPVVSSDILAASSPDLVEQHALSAGRLVVQAASLVSETDPQGALDGLRRHRQLLADPAQTVDTEFIDVIRMAASLINQLEGSPAAVQSLGDRKFLDVFDEVAHGLDETGNPKQAAAAFLRLSWMAAMADLEITGLALLRECSRLSVEFAQENAWVIEPSVAHLFDREGSNRYAAGELSRAMEYYVRSLSYWTSAGREGFIEILLTRIADVAPRADDSALISTVASLADLAPALARVTGRSTDSLQNEIYAGLILAMIVDDRRNSELLWILMQYGSGLRTCMMVAAPQRDLSHDPRLAALVQQLEADRKQTLELPPGAAVPADRVGLRRAFESARETLIVETMPTVVFRSLEELRAVIGSQTVVISSYLLRHPRSEPMRLSYVIWDSDQVIVADPAPDSGLADLAGPIEGVLRDLHASGKVHICLVGPGGTRGESPHVLPIGAGLLADEWLVTSVPHPMLIASGEPRPGRPRTNEMLALGLGFHEGERGQDPIPDAPAEAQAIAALFGAQALVDGDATEDVFRRRAPGARYLHIATHGRFSEETPSFHELLLTPDEQHDGVLYAWEIAELDLRGVELVTLSACESASVSVDRYGNVEGLPLAFLRAGVSTVVGTLWEIETMCSRAFFELFYAALTRIPSRGEAFRSALVETRRRFPDARDWSAFFLVGDWR